MKRLLPVLLILCLFLSGCSIFNGDYTYISPHKAENPPQDQQNVSASNYAGLCSALTAMAESGVQSGIISVPHYDQTRLSGDLDRAVSQTLKTSPIAAWAVEQITWELGASGGQNAVAVTLSYLHDRTEISKIKQVPDVQAARPIITGVLDECGTGAVLLVENYEERDFAQWVEDYGDFSPQTVMEAPSTVVNIYPQEGTRRLVELKFSYQTSRETLRAMQKQVRTIFDSSTMYVSGYALEAEKFERLYSFLMDLLTEGDQPLKTSVTPAYSLLRHGVGNEKAFATVYAAMCREAGLDCKVISGTRNGTSWYWNLISIDGVYTHLDLLRCSQAGAFKTYPDEQMEDYYWNNELLPGDIT